MAAPSSINELKQIATQSGAVVWVSDGYYLPVSGKEDTATADLKYDARWLVQAGRRLTVGRAEVTAVEDGRETVVALALGTVMTMPRPISLLPCRNPPSPRTRNSPPVAMVKMPPLMP